MTHRTAGWFSGWTDPFYTGTPVHSSVPQRWPCAINGHAYLIAEDDQSTLGDVFREEGLPLLRDQADGSELPSESSVSPEQLWRRSQESWEGGAGQTFLDRRESNPQRFYASKGIDPWTPWRFTLLNEASRTKTFAGTTPKLVSTGAYVYGTDGGQTLFRTADGASWTNITGIPAAGCSSLTTAGSTVWAAFGSSGIYQSAVSGTTASAFTSGTIQTVGWVKGHLLAGGNNSLYDIPNTGTLPSALYAHFDAAWRWSSFTEAGAHIYAAGYSGEVGAVYRIHIAEDGSGLEPPIQAAPLPAGEVPRVILGYLGFLVIGTDEGVRFAVPDANGDLTVGALIETPNPVLCLDPYDRFVWFGWSGYDATSTGLGRLDLQTLSAGLAPAYASDLMATGGGEVGGVATLGARRLFAVGGDGVYHEQTTPVDEGTLETGGIVYGLADQKAAIAFDLRHDPLPVNTDVAVRVETETGGFRLGVSTVASSTQPSPTLDLSALRGERFDVTLTLRTTGTERPVVTRWTLLSQPTPTGVRTRWVLPLIVRDEVLNPANQARMSLDVDAEHAFLHGLYTSQAVINVQLGSRTFPAIINDWRYLPDNPTRDSHLWQGIITLRVQEVSA